jgi:hypothetical protein
LADLVNFAEVTESCGDVGERIGRRSGEGELFGVCGAEEATGFGGRFFAAAKSSKYSSTLTNRA